MKNATQLNGFLLIDKPSGITSHDVVNKIRQITGEKKVGHAGTLDPMATGLLIVGIGRKATKEMSKIIGQDKIYTALITLGASSATDDKEGVITKTEHNKTISLIELKKTVKTLTGVIFQIPPNYSAIKQKGKKLYELARKGQNIAIEPRKVEVYKFEITDLIEEKNKMFSVFANIHVSSGTYIRALARDLGNKLKIGGYLSELRRIKIGPFDIKNSIPLYSIDKIKLEKHLIDIDAMLNNLIKYNCNY